MPSLRLEYSAARGFHVSMEKAHAHMQGAVPGNQYIRSICELKWWTHTLGFVGRSFYSASSSRKANLLFY